MIGGDGGVLGSAHQAFGAQQVVVQKLTVFESPQDVGKERPYFIRLQRAPRRQRDLKEPDAQFVARECLAIDVDCRVVRADDSFPDGGKLIVTVQENRFHERSVPGTISGLHKGRR